MNPLIKTVLLRPARKILLKAGLKINRLACMPTVENFIHQSFANSDEVRFIQVGAHDGTHNDPISLFRKMPHWHGLLLEPNPRVFERLVRNLEPTPNCRALNVAVSEQGGSLPFYLVRNPENCKGGQFADQVSSFDREHVEKMLVRFGYSKDEAAGRVQEAQVESVTFDSLLDRISGQNLDILFIDAEGADFRLLKTFPFARLRPKMLVFEFVHLNSGELHELLPFLSKHGYSFLTIGEDVVAVLWPH